ncbi:MAG: hypothetical protein ABJB16_15395 [Saprospiraceae bacterium]
MKNVFFLLIFLASAMSLLTACTSKQTADQYLNDDQQRKDILVAIVHHQPYMAEMMHEMMNSDSSKQMMGESMMSDPGMMKMSMNSMMDMCSKDSSICKMMMGKTMAMCDANQSMCNMMMGSMKSHPNVMKSMKGMCDMENMNQDDKTGNEEHHKK